MLDHLLQGQEIFLKCVEMQKIECDKMLSLDVPTRCNSTYLMLDTAEKFEKAFEMFDLYDGNFNSFLLVVFVKIKVSQGQLNMKIGLM